MKKQVKPSLREAQKKVDEVIDKKIDQWIDKSVDKTLEEIDNAEKQQQKKADDLHSFEKQKTVFALSYFLFFIALIFSKDSRKTFYANQGLVLFLTAILGGLLFRVGLAFLHYELALIVSLVFYVLVFLFALFGFVKTIRGQQFVALPIIGKITLLK